jgi:hypothetical protein
MCEGQLGTTTNSDVENALILTHRYVWNPEIALTGQVISGDKS